MCKNVDSLRGSVKAFNLQQKTKKHKQQRHVIKRVAMRVC